jgi:hypothetical protein
LVKTECFVDDSRNGAWDRLIVRWVGVTLAAFVVQGLWFGIVAALSAYKPEWEQGLSGASTRCLGAWVAATIVGLGWGAFSAFRSPLKDPSPRS